MIFAIRRCRFAPWPTSCATAPSATSRSSNATCWTPSTTRRKPSSNRSTICSTCPCSRRANWPSPSRPPSVTTLVCASVKLTNPTAADKGSSVVWRPGPLPEALALDGLKVRQVLANRLDNAVKFSPPGSTITVETEWAASHWTLTVRNQGPGILDSELIRLFRDFGRTSTKRTGGEPGTGFGLAICYKIMPAHAGSIRADNRPEDGAAFRITLPLPA